MGVLSYIIVSGIGIAWRLLEFGVGIFFSIFLLFPVF